MEAFLVRAGIAFAILYSTMLIIVLALYVAGALTATDDDTEY